MPFWKWWRWGSRSRSYAELTRPELLSKIVDFESQLATKSDEAGRLYSQTQRQAAEIEMLRLQIEMLTEQRNVYLETMRAEAVNQRIRSAKAIGLASDLDL